MAYAYPSPRTGTAQDLLRVVTKAYELELERTGTVLPPKSEAARRWVEPVFRAAGVSAGKILEVLPAEWTGTFQNWLFKTLTAPRNYPFDPASPQLVRARALAQRAARDTGREPALAALISHPPVMGELAHLNIELVRRAMLAMRAVRGRPCRPRLVTAIDPFALDTTSIFEEGLYAGFMGSYHVGVDRLALGRGHLGPALTPEAAWAAMPRRLFRVLAQGGEVGLVLAGGVPSTGRVLYGVREWFRGARRSSPLRSDPAEAARALGADAAFARFTKALSGELFAPPGTWRAIDAWLMAAAAGLLPEESAADAAAAVLACLRVPEAERPGLLGELARVLSRETPPRRRLFRLLCGRVARRRPIVFIPVTHATNPLGVAVGEAWSWEWLGPGRARARRADAPDAAFDATAEAFADRFVEENFT